MLDHLPWLVVGVLIAVAVGVGAWFLVQARADAAHRARAARPGSARAGSAKEVDDPPPPFLTVVVNPTKLRDQRDVRQRITSGCAAAGWGPPVFVETTIEDPGFGQAAAAVTAGSTVVCSLGGDGTVRMVATALVGTDVSLGILPAGTGNLLARNLDSPLDSIDAALAVVLRGRSRRIDVAEATLLGADGTASEPAAVSLVMAGIGMDAAVMGDTSDELKQTVGWPAYFVGGLKNLVGDDFKVHVMLDTESVQLDRRVRSVLVGNCGKLLGGMVLMPNASIDDGRLDVMLASPRGFLGWGPVFARMLTRRRKGHPILDHHRCQTVRVMTDEPERVQVDGDVIGQAYGLEVVVKPGALLVRVPATPTSPSTP